MYYQCDLEQDNGLRITTWIDEAGAKPGATIQLVEGEHIEWWRVAKVHPGPMSDQAFKKQQQLSRNSLSSIAGQK